MRITRVAAVVYTILTAGVIGFQMAMAAGAPWGELAMGGTVHGRFPPSLRAAALVQAALLALTALVVLSRAGLALRSWSRAAHWLVWAVVALSAISSLMNLATPSAGERALWAPVALLTLASSLTVALGARSAERRGHPRAEA